MTGNGFKWVKTLSTFDEPFIKSYNENSGKGFILKANVEYPYIDMNTNLRTEAIIDFEKDFFKLMNNTVFGKTMENVWKHRDLKLVKTDEKRNQLASEPNYYTTKYFSENLIAIEMKKAKAKINKPVYLSMSILDTWYDYAN